MIRATFIVLGMLVLPACEKDKIWVIEEPVNVYGYEGQDGQLEIKFYH